MARLKTINRLTIHRVNPVGRKGPFVVRTPKPARWEEEFRTQDAAEAFCRRTFDFVTHPREREA